ncbi:alpha/beta hydrolase [Corallococcus sp. H22C18031201]|uniref:alpha/beta fold hydrolase n=1 Tax=Citreicoccus inhibens TaxID=2849499 RepID=UPI000E767E27|nr:alpha/beta hydrolase [Citreicoccus inhibens]MBU8900281.1 alpha/beta hydrolase [Citreicoccus inhibens]RJS18318.1 alpha/beta hydrolase [Corallococcus sp. H22C18031201]
MERMATLDEGSGGTPVVFVHSLGGSARQWAAQVRHLRASRRVIAVDLSGHGRSAPPPQGRFDLEGLGEELARTLEGLGVRRAVLVGHSFGADVVLACAAAHPERVAGVLLVDPVPDVQGLEDAMAFVAALDSDAYAQVLEAYWQQALAGARPEVAREVMAQLRATPRESVVGGFRAMLTFDPVVALRRYAGPALSVVTPPNATPRSLHVLSSTLAHQVVPGTSHWLQMDAPESFDTILDTFLASRAR